MSRILRAVVYAVGVIVLVLAVLAIWKRHFVLGFIENRGILLEGHDQASRLKTPDDVLHYIVTYPQNASLAAYRLGDVGKGIFHRAEQKRPLASTMKILVLAEYARQVHQGLLRPDELVDLDAVDVYYLPGTDGGAHPEALKELREAGHINQASQVELRHIVSAMIVQSDNAATDYVIERVGRDSLERLPLRLGLSDQDAPLPPSGLFLSSYDSTRGSPEQRRNAYLAMGRKAYADEVYRLTAMLRTDKRYRTEWSTRIESRRVRSKFVDQRADKQAFLPRGTAKGYTHILDRVYTGSLISAEVSKTMREVLEWPMKDQTTRSAFEALGTKGGSAAGVLTAAVYAKPRAAPQARAVALFFENLPLHVWLRLMEPELARAFGRRLLTDEPFFDSVRTSIAEISRSQ